MSSAGDQGGTTATDPDAIRDEIEQTRQDLAETVDALHHKLDVKGRAKDRVAEVRGEAVDRATTADGKPRPEILAGLATFVVAFVALEVWRRR